MERLDKKGTSLVFGKSSEIGSWIISSLMELRQEVVTIGRKSNISSLQLNDVRDYEGVLDLYKNLSSAYINIDSIYYCFGAVSKSLMHKSDPLLWQEVVDVNLTGAFNIYRAYAEIYGLGQQTKFIYIGSTASISKPLEYSSYTVSKSGLEQIINYINNEAPTGFRACCLRVGTCKTKFSGAEDRKDVVEYCDIRNIVNMLELSRLHTFPDLISIRSIINT